MMLMQSGAPEGKETINGNAERVFGGKKNEREKMNEKDGRGERANM